MSNNGNGHRNGYHCPRCIGGTLMRDGSDCLCILCGFRESSATDREEAKAFLVEAIVARLLQDDSNEIDDIMDRDFKLAGLATK